MSHSAIFVHDGPRLAVESEDAAELRMTSGARVRRSASLTATVDEVSGWLEGLTYKPGWSFALEVGGARTVLVVRASEEDARGGTPLVVNHRFELPSRAIVGDRRSFVGWLRHMVGRVELHERDEWLLVDQRRLFDPHAVIDVRTRPSR
jgi:hypothetical protein